MANHGIINYPDAQAVQKQLDEGYSIYDLLQWGANSGGDVGTIFTDEFKKMMDFCCENIPSAYTFRIENIF